MARQQLVGSEKSLSKGQLPQQLPQQLLHLKFKMNLKNTRDLLGVLLPPAIKTFNTGRIPTKLFGNISCIMQIAIKSEAGDKKTREKRNSARWRARNARKAERSSALGTAKHRIEIQLRRAGEFTEEALKKLVDDKMAEWDLNN
ncbi:hypothetical protein P167DRAFT_580751 [Morchella conica CCBAS932]|uniref:Uncharacterized protein n=1 Tax=Morchella conica CCBAS932 TaxID=1392247 RepID=A0A3N4KAB4_9PEZI|nr:hypothetical protein P167DRAFT_580751 [Morchella conica CCBAS932]